MAWGVVSLVGNSVPAQEADPARLQEQIDALSAQVDMLAAESSAGFGTGTTVGGYAELHYNAPEDGTTVLDFHRFVLLISKPINEWISFYSELEIEHAFIEGGEKSGEVELEQAFLDFQIISSLRARGGILLAPVGIINPVHEPNTFYGVERPAFHKFIIPTTWFDASAGIAGEMDAGFNYELYLMAPLDGSGFEGKDALRGGRQKGFKSEAESLALTGRAQYKVPGLAAGLSFWRGNASSSFLRDCGSDPDPDAGCQNTVRLDIGQVPVMLSALDLQYDMGMFRVRAEYAAGTIGNTKNLNAITGKDAGSAFDGFYVEPSARVWQLREQSLGVFVRYEDINPQAAVAAGKVNDSLNFTKTVAGLNYWPDPDVALKFDYETKTPDAGSSTTGFNLGIGWSF